MNSKVFLAFFLGLVLGAAVIYIADEIDRRPDPWPRDRQSIPFEPPPTPKPTAEPMQSAQADDWVIFSWN